MTRRRRVIQAAVGLAGSPWLAPPSLAQQTRGKVLRYAFPSAETGFDPARINDLYSSTITAHVFETPLHYDHLARPFKIRPLTAVAMPEVSDDFRTFVFRIQPGVLFADDPAFKGRPRELVAQDYVYSVKRYYDPKINSPKFSNLEEEGIVGLRELRDDALKSKLPFDYDRPVDGLAALDRYTLRVRLREGRPRHLYMWANVGTYGAVAREVVESYGEKIMEHPVGTGPFRLAEWRRSSRIVMERNPLYRERLYDAEPNPDDATGQALLKQFKGRRLPMIDRVEIAIIEEAQPRWLAFLNGEHDFMERLPNDFINQVLPGGKLAPPMVKRGIVPLQVPLSDVTLLVFNMEHSVIGGNAPEKVALRRAMALAYDVGREIRLARRGQAIAAQSIMTPLVSGYRAELRTEAGTHDLPRAKALLDLYGYVDRDGDGFRELPDGRPLVLEYATQSDQGQRQLDELMQKDMKALGVRLDVKVAQWPENLKAARAGKFTLWRVGSIATSPDGQSALERLYGPSAGQSNLARFRLPAFDRIYEQMNLLPDGPARQALFDAATRLLVAYAPYRVGVHRIATDLPYPWVTGFRRPPFWYDWWPYIDIDAAVREART